MLFALLVAIWTLGIGRGSTMQALMESLMRRREGHCGDSAHHRRRRRIEAGLRRRRRSNEISAALQGIDINPLLLGWLIATVIRVCLGSATVAGLTAAGIVAPLVAVSGADPNLMVLAIGAGSLMLSHVNDSGFWMFKEYFNLSLKQTLLSWTLMEGIIGVVGLCGVLLLDALI